MSGSSPENPLRPDEDEDDEDDEGDDVGGLDRDEISRDGDDLADDESGDEAADHVAQAAQHADHESDRAEGQADEGMDVVLQDEETGGEPGEAAADRRGHEVDTPLIDPHEAHDLAVLGDGAHCRAEITAAQEDIERDGAKERHGEGEEPRRAD